MVIMTAITPSSNAQASNIDPSDLTQDELDKKVQKIKTEILSPDREDHNEKTRGTLKKAYRAVY